MSLSVKQRLGCAKPFETQLEERKKCVKVSRNNFSRNFRAVRCSDVRSIFKKKLRRKSNQLKRVNNIFDARNNLRIFTADKCES